jgi:hypothetical protein
MIRKTRSIAAGVLFVMAFIIMSSAVFGAGDVKSQAKADVLNRLQLFQGTNKGYELDKSFTRAQGTVMLLRLLGQEDEAIIAGGQPAFTDIKKSHWAAAHISYANNNGLVKGISAAKFAPDQTMNGSQFIALTLRALGYTSADPKNALELSGTSGLLAGKDASTFIGKKVFLRDDMVAVAYSALSTKMNNSTMTLLQKLVEIDHSVSPQVAIGSGLYIPTAVQTQLQNSSDPLDQIEGALRKALNP